MELDGVHSRDPRMASARRVLTKAKTGISKAAKFAQDRRIKDAHTAMVEARHGIERDFYITPLDGIETSPPHPYTAGTVGTQRQSDSNRAQLRPRSRSMH